VHTVSLWDPAGQLLASAAATGETNSGWQSVAFASPVAVTAGTTYTVSYFTSVGHYSTTDGQLAAAGGGQLPAAHPSASVGVFRYGGGYPTSSSSDNYWVDPIFTVPAGVVPHVDPVRSERGCDERAHRCIDHGWV
jgi:hypothetical protein